VIILRLILCDRRTDESASRGSRSGTDPRASTGSSSGGTYQRTSGRARERAETCALARGRFAGAKSSHEKKGGRDRWDKMIFHNALDSNGKLQTDVFAHHSTKL
jgi:hypothetical protein